MNSQIAKFANPQGDLSSDWTQLSAPTITPPKEAPLTTPTTTPTRHPEPVREPMLPDEYPGAPEPKRTDDPNRRPDHEVCRLAGSVFEVR